MKFFKHLGLYDDLMARISRVKNGHEPKICVVCGRSFEWRRKWTRDWEQVRYCSDRCRKEKPNS